MSVKELTTIFLIALADMVTTHLLMLITDICSLGHNPMLRGLCEAIGYGATWLWLPIEFSVIATVYEGLKMLRKRLGARIEVEKIFFVLSIAPTINNSIHLLFMR
jgi:hypothetical protein